MSKDQNAAIGRVIGTMLKEERERTAKSFSELQEQVNERLASADGASVLKSTASTLWHSNIGALKHFCDDITLRRATEIKGPHGEVSKTVKAALK